MFEIQDLAASYTIIQDKIAALPYWSELSQAKSIFKADG